jgi:predicted HicB family RNase H-like nuclease
MSLMRHGDYVARVTYDETIDRFFGEVINMQDVITFYGRSTEELHREMVASIDAHLEACRVRGVEPSRPYSGKFNVRLPPTEHARIAAAAAAAGQSMNSWVAQRLAQAAERELAE